MTSGLPARRTVRASGYAALLGVLVFGVVGWWAVTTDQGPRGPYAADVVAAGTPLDTSSRTSGVVWGRGEALVPEAVTCTGTTNGGEAVDVDVAGLAEPRPTAEILRTGGTDVPPGEMVELFEDSVLPGASVTCSGGGLETYALGELRLGPPWWVVGIGFFVLAGIAAAWALAALVIARRPGTVTIPVR